MGFVRNLVVHPYVQLNIAQHYEQGSPRIRRRKSEVESISEKVLDHVELPLQHLDLGLEVELLVLFVREPENDDWGEIGILMADQKIVKRIILFKLLMPVYCRIP